MSKHTRKPKEQPKSLILELLRKISYEPQLDVIVQMFKDETDGKYKVNRSRFVINDVMYILLDSQRAKVVVGPDYNYIFIKESGFFQRWGKTPKEDPLFSPLGPEILDLEISINGCPNQCPFCYKDNRNIPPTNMEFDTFKQIFDKMPNCLTQIAFGITGCQTNPDFIKMLKYTKDNGVIPNFTLSGIDLTPDLAKQFSELCGAIAISIYQSDKNVGYTAIKMLTDLGMPQINIHAMVSQETLDFVYEILDDMESDERLVDMHAIVFLGVKPKGRAKNMYHSLTSDQYKKLIKTSLDKKINFGFDSCSAPKFELAIKDINVSDETRARMIECSESCESSLFSSYVNVYGDYWHCSFTEEEPGQTFIVGIQTKDFIDDVWYSDSVRFFRQKLIDTMKDGCRSCHVFPEINIEVQE